MKKILTILILAIASFSASAKCISNDSWKGPDKVKHALVGAAVGSGVTLATGSAEYGTLATVFVAGAKEWYDSKGNGTCSLQDFAVTVAAGAAASYGTKWLIVPVKNGAFIVYNSKFDLR